jgi:methyl-accepting chemotaxis protein
MMQRKDLAKEFSLLVQQEIKNHSDSVLACNMEMEKFRSALVEIAQRCDGRVNELHSDSVCLESSMIIFREVIQKSIDKLNRDISDLTGNFTLRLAGFRKAVDERESYFLTVHGFKEFQAKVDQWIANIKVSFENQKGNVIEEVSKSSQSIQKQIDSLNEELKKMLKSEKEKHEDFDKSLDIFALNFSGQTREIELMKKRCFVVEKNIENLYTVIERLKAAK